MGNKFSSRGKKRRIKDSSQRSEKNVKDFCQSNESIEVLEIEHFDKNYENEEVPETVIGMDACWKEEKHNEYTPFESLRLEDFPVAIRHQEVFDYILARGKMVVKVEVSEKSPYRENCKEHKASHCASGYARLFEDETIKADCPFENCKVCQEEEEERHLVYGGVLVTTNRHVIYDDFETEHSEFHFFYESSDYSSDDRVKGRGYALREDNARKDYVGVKVLFHDPEVVEKIRNYSRDAEAAWHRIPPELQLEFEKHAVVVSHPHGWTKQISFGKLLEKEKVVDSASGQRMSEYTTLTCSGSSGSPVMTGFYWNNPFVHSTGVKTKKGAFIARSFFY